MKFTQPFTVTQFWTETTFKVSLEDSDAYSFLQGNCPSHIHLKITSQEDRWRLQSPQSLSHRCEKHAPQAVSLTLFTKAFPTASICDGTKNLYSENSATEALLKKKHICIRPKLGYMQRCPYFQSSRTRKTTVQATHSTNPYHCWPPHQTYLLQQ